MTNRIFLVMFAALLASTFLCASSITEPEKFFGFQPGSDRNLMDYEELVNYLAQLDQESDRVLLVNAGESPMGRDMKICFLSSP